VSKLAEAIAHREGFYVPGSIPNRSNNPVTATNANTAVMYMSFSYEL
jgi:hypothetical protein